MEAERLREIARNCRYVASKADTQHIAQTLLELDHDHKREAAEAHNATGSDTTHCEQSAAD